MRLQILMLPATSLVLSACWGAAAPGAAGGGDTMSSSTNSQVQSTTTGTGGASSTSGSSTSVTSNGGGGAGGTTPCTAMLQGGPAAAPYPFTLGGQAAWSHDDGKPAGYFHTYDALDVGGSAPHKVHVMVPRDYGACDAGYPVVYFNDGNTTFWGGGATGQSWRVPENLEALYAANAIPKVIVVAVEPNDRNFEYSHVEGHPGTACCGADQYTAYLADHVKAFIDANYRTLPGRATTAIIGSSRGGLGAFYVATRRPDVFGKAGCLSSSFWLGLDPVYGGTYPGGALADAPLIVPIKSMLANPALRPRLWIDWGLVRTGGFANAVIEEAATVRGKEMVALLEGTYAYGKDLTSEEDPMGAHDEDSWARRFPDVMKALFAP